MNRRNYLQRFIKTILIFSQVFIASPHIKNLKSFIIITFLGLVILLTNGSIQAETLGQYTFSGFDGCGANNVTSQPVHATFSKYTSTGTTSGYFVSNVFDR